MSWHSVTGLRTVLQDCVADGQAAGSRGEQSLGDGRGQRAGGPQAQGERPSASAALQAGVSHRQPGLGQARVSVLGPQRGRVGVCVGSNV